MKHMHESVEVEGEEMAPPKKRKKKHGPSALAMKMAAMPDMHKGMMMAKANPYHVESVGGGKAKVVTNETGKSHGTTSKRKAMAQFRLLEGVMHGWHPTGKKAKS